MEPQDEIAAKYNRAAPWYSRRYADPAAVARRIVDLLHWGSQIPPGSSVLEIGCADGFVTVELLRAGFRVTAVDIAPAMIEAASRRLGAEGLEADLRVADVNEFEPDKEFDIVLGAMRDFYSYVTQPPAVLRRLSTRTRRKLLVDLNPRRSPLSKAIEDFREAGFPETAWRGFFVPTRYRVGPLGRQLLRAAEVTPGVRAALLRRKFLAVVKGERENH